MKKIKTLEIIKNLIDTEGVEFIPVEKINTIYINYGNTQTSLDNVYNASKKNS